MRRCIFVGCAFVFLIAHAPQAGAFCDNCLSAADRATCIVNLERSYTRISDQIEAVPPAEAEYIRKEKAASLTPPVNRARFNLVYQNRYYHAVQVHDGVEGVMEHLRAAKASLPDRQLSMLIYALGGAGALTAEVSDYLDADSRRPDRVQDDDGGSLSFMVGFSRAMTVNAAQCFLRAIVRDASP